jgi:hypothetical protein
MDNPNVVNLAAAIINDKRYSELKTAVYEELVNKDYATVVAVFRLLQDFATDAAQNTFNNVENALKQSVVPVKQQPDYDPDLDETLTDEELSLRK